MRSETITTLYTLDEARRIIDRENLRKRRKAMRLWKQKAIGLLLIAITVAIGEISGIAFGLLIGLNLIFTKEYWF